jgi:glutathione-regulated potassium-efflux system ancillary protein KefG
MPQIDTDDLIDAQGVADMIGLKFRNAVSEYQRRYPEMPRPVVNLGPGRSMLWSKSAVEKWARETGRIK